MNPPFKFIVAFIAAVGGLLALPNASKAQNNTYYGTGALQSGTKTGIDDSAFGVNSLHLNTTGYYNTAVGFGALEDNTTGIGNTATGLNALLSNNTGGSNTADGLGALSANTTGSNNTATGYQALRLNTTGTANTANGYQALYSCTTDSEDTATGYQALYHDTVGFGGGANQNVADGYLALYNNTDGYWNVADGSRALINNKRAAANVAVGYSALLTNDSDGSGEGGANTAVGEYALYSNLDGAYMTAIGVAALESATNGYNNVAIGQFAGNNLISGSNDIYIADNANKLTDDSNFESDTIRLGELSTQTATYIAGIYDQSYDSNATPRVVYIDSTGKLGTYSATPSSRQFKKDIKPMGDASDVILSLKPVTFQYTKPEYDPRGGHEFGLIAEEVDKICPDLVARDPDGKIYGIRYDAVNAMLLNEFLKEHDTVSNLKAQQKDFQTIIAQQQREITTLTASLKEQASLLQKVSAQVEMNRPAPKVVSNN